MGNHCCAKREKPSIDEDIPPRELDLVHNKKYIGDASKESFLAAITRQIDAYF
jgi:hypothetical protein